MTFQAQILNLIAWIGIGIIHIKPGKGHKVTP